MPFHFVCPYCFKKTLVDETMAGESGPCAGCGKTITVPAAPEKPAEGTAPVQSEYITPREERVERRFAAWILKALGLVAVVGVLTASVIYLMWPTLQGFKKRRDKVACMNQLQQIAEALNEYAIEHGTYPPAVVYDDKGRPMHSWRVLILKQLGQSALYAQYNFDEPWDSAANSLLMSSCPRVFVSPGADDPFGDETNYFLITGRGTVFPKSGPLGPQDMSDGAAGTLLVVEAESKAVAWTNPVDIDFTKLNRQIGATGMNAIGGSHEDGATAVFANGDPAWLSEELDPVLLDAVITPNGNEPIDVADYELP